MFDERTLPAFIGLGYVAHKPPVAIYSKKALLALIRDFGVAPHDVNDYYSWHFVGLHAGANTPVILDDTFGVA